MSLNLPVKFYFSRKSKQASLCTYHYLDQYFCYLKWNLILAWYANSINDMIRLRCDWRKYFKKICWNNIFESLRISFSSDMYWGRYCFSWILAMLENWSEGIWHLYQAHFEAISLLYFRVSVSLEPTPTKIYANKMALCVIKGYSDETFLDCYKRGSYGAIFSGFCDGKFWWLHHPFIGQVISVIWSGHNLVSLFDCICRILVTWLWHWRRMTDGVFYFTKAVTALNESRSSNHIVLMLFT